MMTLLPTFYSYYGRHFCICLTLAITKEQTRQSFSKWKESHSLKAEAAIVIERPINVDDSFFFISRFKRHSCLHVDRHPNERIR